MSPSVGSDSFLKERSFNKQYRGLTANNFFTWLKNLPLSIKEMQGSLHETLVRKDIRAQSARFTLRNLGYCPDFLAYNGLLDLDHTQIFPLLQYLEGIYYAYCIVEDCATRGDNACNIVFLLPNKEFTYYVTPEEHHYFETFRNNLTVILNRMQPNLGAMQVTLFFQPFAYRK